jgi:hypothetical protein
VAGGVRLDAGAETGLTFLSRHGWIFGDSEGDCNA